MGETYPVYVYCVIYTRIVTCKLYKQIYEIAKLNFAAQNVSAPGG